MQVLTRAQLVQMFETGSVIVEPVPSEIVPFTPPNPETVTILAAEVLSWPVTKIDITQQVGRFVLIEYTALQGRDPDLLLVLSWSAAARKFHQIVERFQDLRRHTRIDPGNWYRLAKPYLREIVAPLWLLEPTTAEAAFVMRWFMLSIAQGRRIHDGIPPRLLPVERQSNDIDYEYWSGIS